MSAPDVSNSVLLNINVKSRLFYETKDLERVCFELLDLPFPDGLPGKPLKEVRVRGHMLGKLRRTLIDLEVRRMVAECV